jgi:hypothetical protein
MLTTLVGLWMLLTLVGGTVTLVAACSAGGCGLASRRHPQQAAARERTRQARRLAAEWPLLARPSAWATGTSGPASTASRPPSSWPTVRA